MNIILALFIIVLIADTTSLSGYRHSTFGLVILQSRILSNSHGVLSAYANAEYVFQFLNILQQIIIMIYDNDSNNILLHKGILVGQCGAGVTLKNVGHKMSSPIK